MNVQIEESWKTHLQPEFDKDYFRTLTEFVKSEYSQYQIFPVVGASVPISALISLNIFTSEGGNCTPSLTEKQSPCA